jgi:hypothetical protein
MEEKCNKYGLAKLSLRDLDILKTHAMITLSKAERLMGDSIGTGMNINFESKDFQTMSSIYKMYEDEMNRRIIEIALGD